MKNETRAKPLKLAIVGGGAAGMFAAAVVAGDKAVATEC